MRQEVSGGCGRAAAWSLAVVAAWIMGGVEGLEDKAPEELLGVAKRRARPYLLFEDVKQTPGWRNKDRAPWKEWLQQCSDPGQWKPDVAIEILGMCSNGRYSEERSGEQAMMWAFAYVLTGKDEFLKRTVDLLKGASRLAATKTAKGGEGRMLGPLLIGFGLAYDWVQPKLSPEDDAAIQKSLAGLADATCKRYAAWGNCHDRIIAGSGLGVLALAMPGYAAASGTGPADWLRYGTTHLFVKDSPEVKWPEGLHTDRESPGRPSLCGTLNRGGFNMCGSYSIYWMAQLVAWLNVYSHALGRNALDDFPLARGAVDEPLWQAMPNRMDSQQGTRGQQYYAWYKGVLPLLSPEERGGFRWYAEPSPADPLRERRTYCPMGSILLFCLFDDGLPQAKPSWTSVLSAAGEGCVLRGGWEWDSDWFFLNCMNCPGPSHRFMLHHDNLSFEYCSRGDYLLSDGGEIKHRMRGYGPEYAFGHNTLLVDGMGPVKEGSDRPDFEFVSPARFTSHSLGPGIEFADGEMHVTHVEKNPLDTQKGKALDSPVSWRRTILYPGKEYFVLIDSARNQAKRDYEFLFHLSSLNIVETQSDKEPGRVVGELSVGGKGVDWAREVKTDILTGNKPRRTIGDHPGSAEVLWKTVNLQGKPVELRLVSSPDADKVTVGRTWGRVAETRPPFSGGIGGEVDHPCVGFRHSGVAVTRIAALLARYADAEKERAAAGVKVEGEGVALRIERDGVTDLVAAGKGRLAFEKVSTDAEISLVRLCGGAVRSALLVRGQRLEHDSRAQIAADAPVLHAAFDFAEGGITGHVGLEKPAKLAVLCGFQPKAVTYEPDPEEWIWAWTEALKEKCKPRPLPYRREGAAVVLECPQGAGKIVVR